MALILFCFIVTISFSNSSQETLRPETALNSWRLTPLNTIRFPFSSMRLSFISNFRNPAACAVYSSISPETPETSNSSSYRLGCSALQSFGACTFSWNTTFPAVVTSFSNSNKLCPPSLNRIFIFPSPETFVTTSSMASSKSCPSNRVFTRMSSICADGTAYRYTLR